MLCQQATPAVKVLTFNAAEIGVAAVSTQTLTASFEVSGYSGSFTPTATLHYGHDYFLGPLNCTPGGGSETCTATVTFQPSLPGARKDAIFLMDGTTRLATVLLGGVGQGPMSLLQPGTFSTSIPSSSFNTSGYNYIYQSVADENGIAYILPSGNAKFLISVTKAGVATQIPLTNPPYFAAIGIDGAGVLYIFNESTTVTTYDTVQGIQGTYQIPYGGPDTNWYPGAVGEDNTIYIVDQIRNNGIANEFKPDGSIGYADTLNPGVLQPFTGAVDSAGNFFVGGYEINKITPAGVQTQVNTVGALEGLAVDAADTLYATRYSPTGGVAELPASNYSTAIASIDTSSSPLGVSLGSDGTVYVSNYVNLDIFDRSTTETIDFGEVDAGKSSTVSTASVYNGGNQPLTISGFTLSELSDAGFSLDFSAANACTFGIVLAPGALCQASVVFAPTHAGKFSGTISIASNSLNNAYSNQTIQVTGTSYGSYDVLSPSPLVFAAQAPGTTKALPVTMTNQGNSYASTIYSLATDNPAFTIAQGTCAGVAVQPGASCQLQVTFSSTAIQAYSGNATIVTYVSGTAQAAQTITLPLSGSGAGPVVATPIIAPGTGSYTSSQQVTITDAMASSTIYYTTDSSIPSISSTKYTGAITVNSDETVNAIATASGYTQSAVASATYTFHEAVATVTPASLAFGNQVQGIASVAQTVTLKNTGIGTLKLAGFPITGSAEFSQTNNCAGLLAAGSSCTLSIVFTPASLGAKTATLTVNSDSIQAAPTVTLTGAGVAPPAPTFTPSALAFGSQIVTTTSASLTATLTNPGVENLVLDGTLPTILGPGADSISVASNCPATLAPAATCTVSVTFTPSNLGTYSLSLQLMAHYSSAPSIKFTPAVAITGTGIAQPPPTFTPGSLQFGNVFVGSVSASQTLTLTNPAAGQPITVEPFTFAKGTGAFALNSNCPHKLAAGASCQIMVVFEPESLGAISDALELNYLDGSGLLHSVFAGLTGIGITPPAVLTISPATLDFGNQVVNISSGVRSITFANTSTTDTVAINVGVTGSGVLPQPSSCNSPLAPGASCTAPFIFTPTAIQTYNLSGTVKVQSAVCGGGCVRNYATQTFNITGVGIAQPPVLAISPATLDFGKQLANATSAPLPVTVTNTSATDTIALTDFAIYSPGFSVNFSSCHPPLAPGASCTVYYMFSPTTFQVYNAVTTIQPVPYQCGGCVRDYPVGRFHLTGIGAPQPPALTLSPSFLNFGNQPVNTRSAEQFITVTNASTTDTVLLNDFEIHGPGFDFDFNSCPGSLAPGGSCPVGYYFVPSEYKLYGVTASIQAVPYVCPSGCASVYPPVTFDLVGTGTFPLSYLTPSSLNFTASVGTTSASQTVVLSDYREPVYTVYGVSITGPNANLYHQTNKCGLFLTIGTSCSISITFTPTAAGSYPATLQVLSNDPTSPQTVSLNAFAADSRFTPLIDFGQGFTPNALTLNGPATIAGGALQLTSGPSSAASSVFYPTPVPTKSFDTEFTFQLLDPAAEGITFIIQGDGPNAVGTGGAGLGYQGLAKSVAVKFDLKDTAGEGVDSTGICVNGAAPTVPAVSLASSGIDLHNGHVFALHLSYDGTTMSISLTDTLTQAVWTTKATEDIPSIVGGSTAYFGFTAGSGALAPSAKLAITPANTSQATATSNILTWIYVANGETKTSQTISLPALTAETYGAAQVTLAASATSGLPVTYTVTGPAKLSGATLTITGVGEISVTASQLGNASFASAVPVTTSFTVAKAPLTVAANSLSRAFGAANPKLTYTVSGFVNGDTTSVIGGMAVLATTAVVASPAGEYPISFATKALAAANYNLTYVPGILTVLPTGTQCSVIDYTHGFTNAELSLNGSAKVANGALQLTDGAQFEAGSAFFSTPVPTTSFVTDFTFRLLDPEADGITFVIQAAGPHALGEDGGGLGYAGIPRSVAIKFDLHDNFGEGTNSTGLYADGAFPAQPSVSFDGSGIDLHSGDTFELRIAYDGVNSALTLLDKTTKRVLTATAPGNIAKVIGSNSAYFGFTGGTGKKTAIQQILTWSYKGGTGCPAK